MLINGVMVLNERMTDSYATKSIQFTAAAASTKVTRKEGRTDDDDDGCGGNDGNNGDDDDDGDDGARWSSCFPPARRSDCSSTSPRSSVR